MSYTQYSSFGSNSTEMTNEEKGVCRTQLLPFFLPFSFLFLSVLALIEQNESTTTCPTGSSSTQYSECLSCTTVFQVLCLLVCFICYFFVHTFSVSLHVFCTITVCRCLIIKLQQFALTLQLNALIQQSISAGKRCYILPNVVCGICISGISVQAVRAYVFHLKT